MRTHTLQRTLLLFALLAAAVCSSSQPVLKPGDVVVLTCVEEPALDGEYMITSGGLILLQFVGAVEVKGMTEERAAGKISTTLVSQQILRTATITLTLKGRDQLPVTYGGAVLNAGELPYREGLTLADVIALAGPTLVADLAAVRITHADGSTDIVDFTQYEDGDPAESPKLQAGDRVFIPLKVAGLDVAVLGAVVRPGIILFTEGLVLTQAIERAGGLRSDADPKRVAVQFAAGSSTTVNLSEAGADVPLSPGDKVTVPVRPATEYVYVRGAVQRPGLVPHSDDLTLLKAVQDAVPFEGARLSKVKVVRKEVDREPRTIVVDLVKVAEGAGEDLRLQPGDIVDVPYPARGFSSQDAFRVAGALLFLYFLFRR